MTSAPAPNTGLHRFHPDVSINYQLDRFSDGSPLSVVEPSQAARRIDGYPDYTSERLALSDAVDTTNRMRAVFGPRIRRVIYDDILTDFVQVTLRQV